MRVATFFLFFFFWSNRAVFSSHFSGVIGGTLYTCPPITTPGSKCKDIGSCFLRQKNHASETHAAECHTHTTTKGQTTPQLHEHVCPHPGETNTFPLTHQESRLFLRLIIRFSLSFSRIRSGPGTIPSCPFQVATPPFVDNVSSSIVVPRM